MNIGRRVALLGAPVIAAGVIALPVNGVAAAHCSYRIKETPTPVGAHPSAHSRVVRWKHAGQTVTGPCQGITVVPGGPDWTEVYCSAGPAGRAWINDVHIRRIA